MAPFQSEFGPAARTSRGVSECWSPWSRLLCSAFLFLFFSFLPWDLALKPTRPRLAGIPSSSSSPSPAGDVVFVFRAGQGQVRIRICQIRGQREILLLLFPSGGSSSYQAWNRHHHHHQQQQRERQGQREGRQEGLLLARPEVRSSGGEGASQDFLRVTVQADPLQ